LAGGFFPARAWWSSALIRVSEAHARVEALGSEHPDVATSLENYASLLRATGRAGDAAEMETRA
jgi:hypothetical protein